MRRPNHRRKQQKRLAIVETILFITFFTSLCAMNSSDITIPAIAFIASAVGLYFTLKLEEERE